jgi:predicted small lipoprotein YifL
MKKIMDKLRTIWSIGCFITKNLEKNLFGGIMKKLIGFFIVVSIISLAGCGKKGDDKKAMCQKAMDNMVTVMKNDPGMQKAGAELVDKMLAEVKKDMAKKIDECVQKFDKPVTECIIASKNMQDIAKCGPEKKQ